MEEKKEENEIDEIKKKIFRHPNATDIHIKRIPKDTVDLFKKFANDKFVGDYGMYLKNILEDSIEYQRIKKILLQKGELVLKIKLTKDEDNGQSD